LSAKFGIGRRSHAFFALNAGICKATPEAGAERLAAAVFQPGLRQRRHEDESDGRPALNDVHRPPASRPADRPAAQPDQPAATPPPRSEARHAMESRDAEERRAPSGKVVYTAIVREGEEELARSSSALFLSGLAAGSSMGFSMIAEGLLTAHLPDAPWRLLVAKLGYSVGFLVVILGRQQLFTENTLTPVLPLLQRRPNATAWNVGRLWLLVLVANLLGALAVAEVIAHTNVFAPDVRAVFAAIGNKALEPDFATLLLRGIFAGWLIALIVWLLPFAEVARVWVIILITYVVGIGEFSHVIAGSIEAFTVAAMGERGWSEVAGYVLPTLIGNVIGGVLLVAILNHGQVTSGEDDETLA
jgi:formate/nitrite transporter FocA (FNT family)